MVLRAQRKARSSTAGLASSPLPVSRPLYSRNWAFIERGLQERLAEVTIFTAGTGLGSVIACLAARTGFQRFILADGDVVEESNLNRQPFMRGQMGQNKASATAALIGAIAPHAAIEVVPRFVEQRDFRMLVPRADIVVNTIDMESLAFVELNRVARAAGKTVLFPINIGWGGGLLVFTPDAMSLDEFVGGATGGDVATQVVYGILQRMPNGLPDYLRQLLPRYLQRTSQTWPFDPQLGVAAQITAALAVRTAVALVDGEPVRTAPDLIWCDTSLTVAPFPVHEPAATSDVHTAGKERLHG
jgi:molybdopterin/thiamine biosynthesis adenylyltransferase